MRTFRRALVMLLVATVVASCGSSSSRFSSALPQNVQREIVSKFPRIAYVPTQPPNFPYGSHFTDFFSNGPNTFGLDFSGPEGPAAVGFTVGQVRRCGGASMHTFAVNGVRVRWKATAEDQEAWRCLTRGRITVYVSAGRSVFGDDALRTPQQRIDALLLARMVAHVKYID